jgi:hypothetical protein
MGAEANGVNRHTQTAGSHPGTAISLRIAGTEVQIDWLHLLRSRGGASQMSVLAVPPDNWAKASCKGNFWRETEGFES